MRKEPTDKKKSSTDKVQIKTYSPKELKQIVKLRSQVLTNGTESLFLDAYRNGKRQRVFLKMYLIANPRAPLEREANKETLQLAELIRAKREEEMKATEHDLTPKSKSNADFIQYFENLATNTYKHNSAWYCALVKLKKYNPNRLAFKDITTEWVNGWRDYLLGIDNIKPNTKKLYYRHVKTALSRAIKEKIIISNPYKDAEKIVGEETERVFLTIEEVQAFASIPTKSDVKRAFLFSCYTGLRISDIRALQWKHINLKSQQIFLILKKSKRQKGKGLYLALSDMAIKLLGDIPTDYETNESLVFKLPQLDNIEEQVRRVAKKAGIAKYLTYHSSRHTFAVQSIKSGSSILMLKENMGQDDINSTLIYAKIMDVDKIEAVNNLPQITLL